ncbi:GIN domain-containing protein [Sphingomonas sp. CFBP9019]|uniref:GIN domain-containing protein n=1 Tax=Sphingomonas sp. CFBP9019 TaxID=3096532 RepID=UPI002A69A130|nr:DUF2807 domain-containing protein [Sphingomonas sp. CFBP9019]MDY1009122.1 DUF2807 domain-containing protein [Sphingomonas sp. CFBP9019]
MIRFLALLLLFACPVAAAAADRSVSVGSFERVRIDGPFDVRLVTGSPGAKVSGDPHATEAVEIRVDGATLSVRRSTSRWGERPEAGAQRPVIVMLSTPRLAFASVVAGGRLTIERMKGMRLDLAVSGAGSLAVNDAQADQLNAAVIGTGRMTLAGRSARARLTVSGPGLIDATALAVDDLVVMQDGVGETRASARRTAQVTNGGAGSVTVAGTAACTVRAAATGPVICGR